MSKSDKLFERREKIVPRGAGIFSRTTIASAKDATVMDEDGREYIDFGGGIGVLNAGHSPLPVVNAIKIQAEKFLHSCFHVSAYEVYVQLAEKLAEMFPHGQETKVLLTNTGAEAVENAIKIARQYTKRGAVICYTGGFHGRSMMAMSLTSKVAYKYNCGPFAPEVYRLPFPNVYRYSDGLTEEQFVKRELHRLRESFFNLVDPKQVAAIIVEPVQGEGGFNVMPKEYMKGLRQVCDEHGILLILDEVQSGFCRTGKWAAYQHYDVTPDISTWAKSIASGMPLGAVIGRAEVMDGPEPGTIGGTYLGNPVSCAASLATIDYMQQENLNKRAQEVGQHIRQRMEKLKGECPAIGDVRGLGAMMAFELVKNGDPKQPDGDLCAKLMKACLNRGLLLLSAGTFKNVVRILGPLVIEDAQLNKGLDIIEEELLNLSRSQEKLNQTAAGILRN